LFFSARRFTLQLRFLPALILFVGSYSPLSLIVLAQDVDWAKLESGFCFSGGCEIALRNPVFSIGLFLATAICTWLTHWGLNSISVVKEVTIQSSKHVPAELMSYTLPYIVAFMSLDLDHLNKSVGIILFLGWMFIITYRSGQIVLNPLLSVFGWRLFDISFRYSGDQETYFGKAIAKNAPEPNSRWQCADVQDIMLLREKEI